MKHKTSYIIMFLASIGILFTICILSACSPTPKITSITYQSHENTGITTYILTQQGDSTPVMSVSLQQPKSDEKTISFKTDEDAMDIAFEKCIGFTMWNPNAGDIDSKIGTMTMNFDDGSSYTFAVTSPLNGKHSRGEADKVASYLVQLAENHRTD